MKALVVRNLRKVYHNGVVALDGISFSVERGSFLALLGPNGAGKSTTIGIMTSIVKKTSGYVEINGHDIDHHFQEAKYSIGVVPQEFNFNVFHRVIDIVLDQAGYYGIPRKKTLLAAEKYLRQLNLWDKRYRPARSLSGGFKRRLMIVRALIHDPDILILDEPTAGVDVEIRRSMWHFLQELNQSGKTIVLTTHYLEEAEYLCHDVAIINHGKVIKDTTMFNLLQQLDSEYFILYLQAPLKQIPVIAGCHFYLKEPKILELTVPKHFGLTQIIKSLADLGILVMSMRNKTNRLEELFLKLTEKV